jgi:hypothetical protein
MEKITLPEKLRKALEDLTYGEKELLQKYIFEDKTTQYFPIYDGIANALEAKNILCKASSVTVPGRPGMLCPYNLQPYARTFLSKRRDLLELKSS